MGALSRQMDSSMRTDKSKPMKGVRKAGRKLD